MKAILFDFDGTLAHTLPVCFEAFQEVFRRFDERELTNEDIISMFGPSETGIIRENLKHTDSSSAIELYYTVYSETHDKLVPHSPEIIELLGDLRRKGYQLGIVTGKAQRSLDLSLEALKMTSYFDVVITGDDVTNAKPHPEGIQQAMKRLGVTNEDTIYLGDSDADILAGIDAGVRTVGVYWLPNYQPTFTQKPDVVCNKTTQLLTSFGIE